MYGHINYVVRFYFSLVRTEVLIQGSINMEILNILFMDITFLDSYDLLKQNDNVVKYCWGVFLHVLKYIIANHLLIPAGPVCSADRLFYIRIK